ncbi:M30 family zinc metallopeptidase [Crenobacter caeni]|uniref:Uncharacterized protein n=1 Tax=Crenobacter caeni TaxID=2705474 RepID=A0A6B2KN49_9NEIS|nr:hypothetical protein [Crenobacter caeni]
MLTYENQGSVPRDLLVSGIGGIHTVSAVLYSSDTTPNDLPDSGSGGRLFDAVSRQHNSIPVQISKENLQAPADLRDLLKNNVGTSAPAPVQPSGNWTSIVNDNITTVPTAKLAERDLPNSGGGKVVVWGQNTALTNLSSCGAPLTGDDLAKADMKVSICQAQAMADMFASKVYLLATELIGTPWGNEVPAALQSWLLDRSTKDIHIVLLDITPDGQPLGTIGYYWSVNSFRKGVKPYSNEALVFYMDAATFAKLDRYTIGETEYGAWRPEGTYPALGMTTLAHEFQHMIQFYQKQVRHGAPVGAGDTFQNETAAQALGYLAGRKMFPDVETDPHLRTEVVGGFEGEFRQSLGYSGCLMDSWGGSGDMCSAGAHYPQALSLAMYMLHQYGPGILKDWVQGPENGIAAIEKGLASASTGLKYHEVVRRWGISTRMEKAAGNLGFPARKWPLGTATIDLGAVSPGAYFNFKVGSFTTTLPAASAPRYAVNVQPGIAENTRVRVPGGSRLHLVVY